MTRKTTLEDIARAAGVSLATVDRVVNRRGGVSARAEARVLEWCVKLDLDRRMPRAHLRLLRIGILMPSPANPFFEALRDSFQALDPVAREMSMRYHIHHLAPREASATARRVRDLAQDYDGLIICSPDHPEVSAAVDEALARIPVVTIVNDLPSSGRIAYVGPDNLRMGRVAAELMGRFIGPAGGEVLILLGMRLFAGHRQRGIGFRRVMETRFPACRVLDPLESEEDDSRAAQVVARALGHHPDVRGIYNTTWGNRGIMAELRARSRAGEVVLVTHELTRIRRKMLGAGEIDAVLDQNPALEARRALDIIAGHFNRAAPGAPAEGETPFDIVLSESCAPL